MSIEVEQLESWIGSEASDGSGQKLGKIDDVYFAGAEPVAIAIRSGLGGRKRHIASLKGASVSQQAVRLAVGADDLLSTDGGALTSDQLSALAARDERLTEVRPEEIEGFHQREERRKEAEAARATADKLEAEAAHKAEEEKKATSIAGDAESTAEQARRDREEADARAQAAREEAEARES